MVREGGGNALRVKRPAQCAIPHNRWTIPRSPDYPSYLNAIRSYTRAHTGTYPYTKTVASSVANAGEGYPPQDIHTCHARLRTTVNDRALFNFSLKIDRWHLLAARAPVCSAMDLRATVAIVKGHRITLGHAVGFSRVRSMQRMRVALEAVAASVAVSGRKVGEPRREVQREREDGEFEAMLRRLPLIGAADD